MATETIALVRHVKYKSTFNIILCENDFFKTISQKCKTFSDSNFCFISCACLENKEIVELWVRSCPSTFRLTGSPVIWQKSQLHQSRVGVETGREVSKAEQEDHKLLAAVSVLHREEETSSHARRRGHHLVYSTDRVQACQHRPHRVPT